MSLINIDRTIELDVYDHDTTPSVIKTIQMDESTRTVFAMIQNARQNYDIGQNASVSLTVLRPDKTKVQITGQTFSYNGTDGTMYGAKADLSDVALAVKGNLKAQFKFTSGEQELRTEIFTINNGEALDAGDGDWAGDLDGHNLDEMAESIETLQTDMAAVENVLPQNSTEQTLTVSVGLINKYGQTTTAELYEHGELSVTSGEEYTINGFYYGGNFPAVVFMNGTSVVSVINGTVDRTEYTGTVIVPSDADKMVINGRVADYRAKATTTIFERIDKPRSYDSILVGSSSEYDYQNINTAVIDNPNKIISVDYGTYETEIENLATNKTIIGKDVDLCVLTGTDKDYDHPPIEIAGGTIKNITVTMTNATDADHKGYCLHSDNAATVDNTLYVENCKFKCVGQHAVGLGVRSGETVVFKNCYFEQLDNAVDTNPVYLHNSAGANPSVVRFHNCYFRGYAYCMKLQAWGSGNSVQFEFINCTCISETYGTADDCVWTDYVSGSTHDTTKMHEFSGKFTLLSTSHGNNVSALNAI